MPTSVERDVVRVTVRVGEMNIDLSLPNKVPVRELAIDVAKACVPLMEERDISPEWLRNPTSEVVLSPSVGRTWSSDVTLDRAGVRDGDHIVLSTVERNERYPELIEVMQDATSAIRNAAFAPWETETSVRFASIAFPIFVALASLIGGWLTIDSGGGVLGGALIAVAASCAGLSVVIGSNDVVNERIVTSLSAATYVPAMVAVALFIPGGMTHWAVLAAAAAGLVIAVLNVVFKQPTASIHMSVATFAGVTTVGVGVAALLNEWRDMSVSTMAACVMTAALLAFYFEPGLSRAVAQLELPYLPLDTESGEAIADAEISEITKMLSQESSWESMLNQRDRNLAARAIGVGIGIGAAAALALSAVIAATHVTDGKVTYIWPSFDQRSVLLFHILICCLLFVLQGSWYRDRLLRGIALAGGGIAVCAALVAMAANAGDWGATRVVVGLSAVAVAVVVSVAVAWRGRPSRSLRMRQWGEKIEALMYLFPLVNIASLINIFFLIRHR